MRKRHDIIINSKSRLPIIFVEGLSKGAGGSVWYERRLRKAEVAGSNPARSIIGLEPVWVLIPSARILSARIQ